MSQKLVSGQCPYCRPTGHKTNTDTWPRFLATLAVVHSHTQCSAAKSPRPTSGVSGELLLHRRAIQNGPVLNIWMSRMRMRQSTMD